MSTLPPSRSATEARDVMIQTMEREFPPEAKFTHPNGGLFTWVELPDYINTNEMAKQCLARNVAYVRATASSRTPATTTASA